jgi:hypothetical protein
MRDAIRGNGNLEPPAQVLSVQVQDKRLHHLIAHLPIPNPIRLNASIGK